MSSLNVTTDSNKDTKRFGSSQKKKIFKGSKMNRSFYHDVGADLMVDSNVTSNDISIDKIVDMG